MSEQSQGRVEWFESSGRATGVLMLLLWAVIAGFAIAYGAPLALLAALLFAAVLTYVTMLRPRVGTTSAHLIYRQMFSDLSIPLARVDGVRVTRYLEATVGPRRYVSPAISRPRRRPRRRVDPRIARFGAGSEARPDVDAATVYADRVEHTIRARVDDAQAAGQAAGREGEIRRTWAWFDICLAAVTAMLLLFLVI